MVKMGMFLADGFEECEALITLDMLRRAKMDVDTISIHERKEVTASHNIVIQADCLLEDVNLAEYDVLILPGGKGGTDNLDANEEVKASLVAHAQVGKLVCAICAAPSVLGHIGILEGKTYTCYPGFEGEYGGVHVEDKAVTDGNVITGKGMGAAFDFVREILKQFQSEEEIQELFASIQY